MKVKNQNWVSIKLQQNEKHRRPSSLPILIANVQLCLRAAQVILLRRRFHLLPNILPLLPPPPPSPSAPPATSSTLRLSRYPSTHHLTYHETYPNNFLYSASTCASAAPSIAIVVTFTSSHPHFLGSLLLLIFPLSPTFRHI